MPTAYYRCRIERVVILGSAGAGKSTLARELGLRTGLPVVYLDHLFWRPGWAPAPRDEARRELATAIARERWILDGNFLGGDDERFARADTVVFLDVPRRRCLWRVLSRLVRDRGRPRADLPEGCGESLDLPLLRWIWGYPSRDRPRVLELLASLDEGTAVHRLRTPAEVRRFLEVEGARGGGPLPEEP